MRPTLNIFRIIGSRKTFKSFKYFAWVYDEKNANKIIDMASNLYEYVISNDAMKDEYSKFFQPHDPSIDPKEYLNREKLLNTPTHTTAYFCQNDEEYKRYFKRPEVKNALNESFTMKLIGVQITYRTLGVRVLLPDDALCLFESDEKGDDIHDVEENTPDTFSNTTYEGPNKNEFTPGLADKEGKRATHITIRTNDIASAKDTGIDLMDIMKCEDICKGNKRYHDVKGSDTIMASKLRYYGGGRFAFYLNEPMVFDATFKKLST